MHNINIFNQSGIDAPLNDITIFFDKHTDQQSKICVRQNSKHAIVSGPEEKVESGKISSDSSLSCFYVCTYV